MKSIEKQPRKNDQSSFGTCPVQFSRAFLKSPNRFGTIVREPHVVFFSEIVLSKHGCQTKHNQTF